MCCVGDGCCGREEKLEETSAELLVKAIASTCAVIERYRDALWT